MWLMWQTFRDVPGDSLLAMSALFLILAFFPILLYYCWNIRKQSVLKYNFHIKEVNQTTFFSKYYKKEAMTFLLAALLMGLYAIVFAVFQINNEIYEPIDILITQISFFVAFLAILIIFLILYTDLTQFITNEETMQYVTHRLFRTRQKLLDTIQIEQLELFNPRAENFQDLTRETRPENKSDSELSLFSMAISQIKLNNGQYIRIEKDLSKLRVEFLLRRMSQSLNKPLVDLIPESKLRKRPSSMIETSTHQIEDKTHKSFNTPHPNPIKLLQEEQRSILYQKKTFRERWARIILQIPFFAFLTVFVFTIAVYFIVNQASFLWGLNFILMLIIALVAFSDSLFNTFGNSKIVIESQTITITKDLLGISLPHKYRIPLTSIEELRLDCQGIDQYSIAFIFHTHLYTYGFFRKKNSVQMFYDTLYREIQRFNPLFGT